MATADRKAREIAGTRINENEALIESSFRRLLASIESERERMRSTWRTIDYESDKMHEELEQLSKDTDEWCDLERAKVQGYLREVDEKSESMTVRLPDASEVLHINCSGKLFQLPKSLLRNVEGSLLNHMFSDEFIQYVPMDREQNFFLDFNPICFGIIVKYLQMGRPDKPMPDVPPEQQMNMDLLVEALHLNQFMKTNEVSPGNKTSLKVLNNTIEATHEGWQVVSAIMPLPMAGVSFFEITVIHNPTRKGCLSVGVCGHVPTGNEVHTPCPKDSVMYSSGNGLIGGNISTSNVQSELIFEEGHTLGVKHDVHNHSLTWYHNRLSIGTCFLRAEALDKMRTLYPVFALFQPGQRIQVDFPAGGGPRVAATSDAMVAAASP